MERNKNICILDEKKNNCTKCGECDTCDIDRSKICDNCMECIFTGDTRYLKVDEIRKNIYKGDK